MKENVYSELLGQVVRIDSTCYYQNEIVDMLYSIYEDCSVNGDWYKFNDSKKVDTSVNLGNLGCLPKRSREEVIFEPQDMFPFVTNKINKWKQLGKNSRNVLLESSEDIIDYGYAMMIVPHSYCPKIIPVYFRLTDSYQTPYQLIGVDHSYAVASGSDLSELAERVYFFNEEDIEQMIVDFEAMTRI